MMLHPTKFEWNWKSPIYDDSGDDSKDWEFLDLLPKEGIGKLFFPTCCDRDFGFFLIHQEEVDALEEDYNNADDLQGEYAKLKLLVDTIVGHAKAHPSSQGMYLFVFDM